MKIALMASMLLTTASVAAAAPAPPPWLSTRHVVLSHDAPAALAADGLTVWVTIDGGVTWRPAPAQPVELASVRAELPHDGLLGVRLAWGAPRPPRFGAVPDAWLLVDSVPPVVQVHAVAPVEPGTGERTLRIEFTLIEDNLGSAGLRVFYRNAAGESWIDGGAISPPGSPATWSVPPAAGERIDLRLVATDRAGNRRSDERLNVQAPRAAAAAVRPAQRAGATSGAMMAGERPGWPEPDAPDVPPIVAGDQALAPRPVLPQAQRLRAASQRHAERGEVRLAAARLRDALEVQPDHTDLLVDLGELLIRGREFDEAERLLERAANIDPRHVAALEGLALIAASSGRYEESQRRLERLLSLVPDSDTFRLRLGDVSFRLGQRERALQVWRQVLDLPGSDPDVRSAAERRLQQLGRP